MKKILLAGATGYLGSYILKELIKQGYQTRAVVRNPDKLINPVTHKLLVEVMKAELTQPSSIKNCCKNIETVISTVGITKQRDGLIYMDVDFQANMNLLEEAKRADVKKFIYISVLNGEKLKHLKICEAKENFVAALKQSDLNYCIIRPNGFFPDLAEFIKMAQKGRIYLFGSGEFKANPIQGKDLAQVCVDAINQQDKEIPVGGPQVLTQNHIAEMAFNALNKKPKVTHIPASIRTIMLTLVKAFTNPSFYGPIEFFLTVMAMDMIAPEYGQHTLEEYYNQLNSKGTHYQYSSEKDYK